MPIFKFHAGLKEVELIEIAVEADSEEDAREIIDNREFDWKDNVRHKSYIESELFDIELVSTI